MRAIPAAELLEIWERGSSEWPLAQALRLLAAAFPEEAPDSLSRWGFGQRDSALLSLRERLFGERLSAVAQCPACGERVELEFRTSDIRAPYLEGELLLEHADDTQRYRLRIRPLTTHDFLAGSSTRDALLRCCVVEAHTEQGAVPADALPRPLLDRCARMLADSDAQADVRLALTCPGCQRAWDAPFDVVAYLWRELDTWARRTLREVHLLARAYGWCEDEILALSPKRRSHYLELVAP